MKARSKARNTRSNWMNTTNKVENKASDGDVPDADASAIGERMAAESGVTLCYRRPRRLPDWPYNLFCMIHGRERTRVLRRVDDLRRELGIRALPHAVLFSGRCFTQHGARYAGQAEAAHG